MNVGHKPTQEWASPLLLPARQPQSFRHEAALARIVILLACVVLGAVVLPALSPVARWVDLLMLLAAIVPLPRSHGILVAGSGPGTAIVTALLGTRAVGRDLVTVPSLADAAGILRSRAIRTIIVPDATNTGHLHTIADARGIHPAVIDATDAVGTLLGRLPVQLADRDVIAGAVSDQPRWYRAGKRTLDITAAVVIGLALLILLPLIALAIRVDSPGRIFYSQERVGKNGESFRIHKFRSMRQDAERNGAVWSTVDDPRVTRIGRLMRRTRVDELPQMWNVLRGDMTLVGPRPERPEFTAQLEQEIPGYTLRTLVKPGLTGWAQVTYQYTNSVAESRTKLEYDLYYVKSATLMLDLKILVKTVAVVIRMAGR